MPNNDKRMILAIPILIIIILLINIYLNIGSFDDYSVWPWAKILFSIALILFNVGALYLLNYKESWLRNSIFNNILYNPAFSFFFIPGARILTNDYEEAKKGPSGYLVSLNALLVLFLAITGTAFFSAPDLAINFGLIPKNWFLWSNKDHWLEVFIYGFVAFSGGTILVNFFTIFSFSLGYKIDESKSLIRLSRYFGINLDRDSKETNSIDNLEFNYFWRLFSGYLDNIYGHKVWGGKGISTIIDTIRKQKDKLGTSQWFILEFAADVLEHHIPEDKLSIRMSYDNPEEYSKFLARTMQYCTKNIIWIVDKNDFTDFIFPIVVREVLFSIVQQQLSTSSDGNEKALCLSLSEISGKSYESAAQIKGFCSICKNSTKPCRNGVEENPCTIAITSDKESVWLSILEDFQSWAVKKIEMLNDNILLSICSDDQIWNLCSTRSTDALGFPHMRSYYEHNVPKSRIIELPGHPGGPEALYTKSNIKEDTFERIIDRIYSINHKPLIDKFIKKSLKEKVDLLSDIYVPGKITQCAKNQIYIEAWKLFGHLSNNGTHQKIVGFAEIEEINSNAIKKYLKDLVGDRITYDIGLYDNSVMVNSWQSDKDLSRSVVWTMLLDGHEIKNTLSVFNPQRELSLEEQKKVFLLSDFISSLDTILVNDK
jgi:hypothetical protein